MVLFHYFYGWVIFHCIYVPYLLYLSSIDHLPSFYLCCHQRQCQPACCLQTLQVRTRHSLWYPSLGGTGQVLQELSLHALLSSGVVPQWHRTMSYRLCHENKIERAVFFLADISANFEMVSWGPLVFSWYPRKHPYQLPSVKRRPLHSHPFVYFKQTLIFWA